MSNYITRRKIIERACHDLLKELYMRAQPAVNIDTYVDCYKRGILDKDKDHCYEWHYLPAEVEEQIVNDYLVAYNADDQFKKWAQELIDKFKNGGYRTVYKDIFNTGEKVRTGEETEKLNELIGDENADKVYNLINEFLNFYRTNMDEHSIRWMVMQGPTSNPETVIAKWGDKVKIDDSVYKGYDDETWDYTYKDYYDGRVSEEYLEELEWQKMEEAEKTSDNKEELE